MLDEPKANDPLYLQIYSDIKKDIETGVLKPGDQIPTEIELMKQYEVSRITVRNSLKKLTNEGLLERSRGKGSFVTIRHYQRSLKNTISFTQICINQGLRPGAHTIKCCLEDASEEDLEELDLPLKSKVVTVERIRYANDVPVSFEITHFTEDFDFLITENLDDTSMYGLIQEKHNVIFSDSQKTLELIYSNYTWSKYLQIPNNSPLLSIKSIVCTDKGIKAQRSHQLIVGNKFKLII